MPCIHLNTADIWENIKETFLSNSMWYKDTAGPINDLGNENVGATNRHNLTAIEKKVDMIGYIHDDVLRQARLLSPGLTVKVTL